MASTKKNSAMKLSKIESCDDDYEHCNLIRSNSTRKLRAILFHFFFKDCQTMSPVLCLIDSAYQQTQANEKNAKILKKFHFVYRSVFFFFGEELIKEKFSFSARNFTRFIFKANCFCDSTCQNAENKLRRT